MKQLNYESYATPRNDLVIEAIRNDAFIDGDIWRTFLDTCDAVQIVAVGFGGITEDNFERNEIDKYYVFNLYGIDYKIWSYISMDEQTEEFPTQIAHRAIKIEETKTITRWEIDVDVDMEELF